MVSTHGTCVEKWGPGLMGPVHGYALGQSPGRPLVIKDIVVAKETR